MNDINGNDIAFDATIDSDKKVITIDLVSDLSSNQIVFVKIDAEVEDMIDAGIHVCIASGNQYYKIDVPTGLDYNNEVTLGLDFMRGEEPYKARFSNRHEYLYTLRSVRNAQ